MRMKKQIEQTETTQELLMNQTLNLIQRLILEVENQMMELQLNEIQKKSLKKKSA